VGGEQKEGPGEQRRPEIAVEQRGIEDGGDGERRHRQPTLPPQGGGSGTRGRALRLCAKCAV